MPDRLDDRLRAAMHRAAEGMDPAAPSARTRAELLGGLARRRNRRRARAAGALAGLALVAVAAGVALPKLLDQPPSRHLLVGAGATARTAPGPQTAVGSSAGRINQNKSGNVAAPQGRPLGPALDAPTATPRPSRPAKAASPSASGPPVRPNLTPQAGPTKTAPSTGGAIASTAGRLSAVSPPIVLTGSDTGRTVSLSVGQTLTVDLAGSPGRPWAEPTSTNPAVVVRMSDSLNQGTGAAGAAFRAIAPGRVRLSATQGRTCSSTQPKCPPTTPAWVVTIRVSTQP